MIHPMFWHCIKCGHRFLGDLERMIYWVPLQCSCGGKVVGFKR